MPEFGKKSLERIKGLHPDLQAILNQAINITDFTVLEGYRPKEVQDEYYRNGLSKLKWPESKHNKNPALAVDIAPYPVDWRDKARFHFLAGVIKAIAHKHGRKIRWGGDWDSDGDCKDQTFDDLPHFELMEV